MFTTDMGFKQRHLRVVAERKELFPVLEAVFESPAFTDGVAKSPTYGVTLFFQDLDLQYVGLHP